MPGVTHLFIYGGIAVVALWLIGAGLALGVCRAAKDGDRALGMDDDER
jgi:hypothetical protein